MAAVAKVAKCTTYHDGEVLIKAGKTKFVFHVIKKGAIEVLDCSGNEPKVLLVHEATEFTGDMANLAGRASNLSAVAKGTVEVYEIRPEELQEIINEQPDLRDGYVNHFYLKQVTPEYLRQEM